MARYPIPRVASRFLSRRTAAQRSHRGGERGFGLTEFLVVATIAVCLSVVAVVQGREGVRRYRLQESASMLTGKLTEARINALKRNRPTWLLIDAEEGTVQVQRPDEDGDGLPEDTGTPGRLSAGIIFIEPPVQIDYDAMGRPTAVAEEDRSVQVQDTSGQQVTVTVALTGTATVN